MKEQSKQLILDEARDLLSGTPSEEDIETAIVLLRTLTNLYWIGVRCKK